MWNPIDRLKATLSSTNIDFVAYRRVFAIVSALMVMVSWVLFFTITPNWGIDFTGGTELHLQFQDQENPVEIQEIRSALQSLGLGEDAVQRIGSPEEQEYMIRIQDPKFGSEQLVRQVNGELKKHFGEEWFVDARVDAEVGIRITVVYSGDRVKVIEVADALTAVEGVVVQEGKEDNEVVIKLPGLSRVIKEQISGAMKGKAFEVLATEAVGPKVGGDLRRQGFISIAITLGIVLVYIAFRFDIGFAPGAVLALVHDVSLTVGVFVLLQKEINLPIIGALLTIVGYSLNDTIVIYDRIRENRDRYRRHDTPQLINVSINETLARTLATSVTTLLALAAFLIMGGAVIEDFAFAMALGVVFGTYSTVYVASPMILVMQDVKPHLFRMLAVQGVSAEPAGAALPDSEEEVQIPDRPLTASERRRQERAKLEQQ